MPRKVLAVAFGAALLAGVCPSLVAGQSKAAKIASAMAAAPASIARNATVKDWPDAKGNMALLRSGSNGWTCMPSHAKSQYTFNDAMCLDANFSDLIDALFAQKTPALKGIGYAYMLSTDDWESNTDPAATKPTASNQWHHVRSHVMVAYPDKASVAGLPSAPSTNGPYVMWANTPYAHVMWPVK